MAEALGVAASGIAVVQVAMVVGKSVIALRNLWNEVRDVPDSITHLMQQVDIMSISLGAMEQNLLAIQAIGDCEDIVGPALEYAGRARDEFVALVDDLGREINAVRKRKRVVARLKVVLGQNQLARCESRLRGAVQLLGFAQQTSAFAFNARLPDLIIARIMPFVEKRSQASELIPNGTDGLDTSEETESGLGPYAIKGQCQQPHESETYDLQFFTRINQQTACTVRLKLPLWLTRKVWELSLSRAISGWRTSIKTYKVIEPESAVHTLILEGRCTDVIDLFHSGLALPFDVDSNGLSLLDWAMMGPVDIPFVRFLQSLGVRPERPKWFSYYLGLDIWRDARKFRHIFTLFVPPPDGSATRMTVAWLLLSHAKTVEVCEAALEFIGREYFYSIPLRVRVLNPFPTSIPNEIFPLYTGSRMALDRGLPQSGDATPMAPVSRYTEPKFTIIGGCRDCHAEGDEQYGPRWWGFEWWQFSCELRERLASRAQLGPQVRDSFLLASVAIICDVLRNAHCPGLKERDKLWLDIDYWWLQPLEKEGVDMKAYCEKIKQFYETDENFWIAPEGFLDRIGGRFGPRDHSGFRPSLTGLAYDDRLKKLKMVWDTDYYLHPEYARQFWYMAEGTQGKEDMGSRIPGAWVDEE